MFISKNSVNGRAFTLVELLVVIAIIGVLVALLLPAIQAARESARRTQCVNQLKQMGLAVLNHESTKKVFPSGGRGGWPEIENNVIGGKPLGPKKQQLGLFFQILPYLEQNAVHGLSTTEQLIQTPIGMYFCPSRRAPTQNQEDASADYEDSLSGHWLLDYNVVAAAPTRNEVGTSMFDNLLNGNQGCKLGVGFISLFTLPGAAGDNFPKIDGKPYVGGKGVIIESKLERQGDGTYRDKGFDGPIGFRHVTDGSSNTVMISEKRIPVGLQDGIGLVSGALPYDDRGWSDGWDGDTVGLALCPLASDADLNADLVSGFHQSTMAKLTLGAAHPGVVNALFVDGSVHSINYDVEPETFNQLAHRSDGAVVDLEDL